MRPTTDNATTDEPASEDQATDGAATVGLTFEQFFAEEADPQVRRATLLLGSVDDANDVVQEALTRLYQRWGDLDDPGPYLNRTVLNLCRDRARHQAVHRRVLPRLVGRAGDRDGTAPDGDPGHEMLDDILAELPFNQRAAVVLRYWSGLSTEEIAAELDCAPGSVGPWISRALKKMRKALQ